MRSRNATTGDNSMYCMIPDPFPSTAFGKGSATPGYSVLSEVKITAVIYGAPFVSELRKNGDI